MGEKELNARFDEIERETKKQDEEYFNSHPKTVVPRDKKYLRWLRNQPCMIEGCCEPQDTVIYHHIVTEGIGTKCSDYRTVPLCYKHHLGNESVHLGRERFEKRFEVDLEVEAEKYHKLYQEVCNDM